MPVHEPQILQSAWEDIAGIADFLLQNVGARAAEETTDKLLDTIGLLGSMPYLGPLHHDPVLGELGFRKLLCGKNLCVYRVVDDVPAVYHVFHSRQDYAWRVM